MPRSAFLLVWDQPPMTVGRGSFLTELMARAGLRNVFDDVGASSAVISIEGVVARDPDVILTLGTASPKIAGRPEWEVVPAVRDRRFVHADGSEFSHPGPRSPQAIRSCVASGRWTVRARRPDSRPGPCSRPTVRIAPSITIPPSTATLGSTKTARSIPKLSERKPTSGNAIASPARWMNRR